MTKHEAVATIMRRSGLLTPPSLDTGGASMAGQAERILDEEDLRIQAEGWHNLTRTNKELSPSLYTWENASWDESELRLVQADKFATATVGQTIEITSGATAGQYGVAAVDPSGNYVDLDSSISSSGDIASGIAGEAVNNKISVPAGVISIDNDPRYEAKDVTHLGARLYDLDNNTDKFSASVKTTLRYRYLFDCVPYEIRVYIALSAALRFNEAYGKQVGASDRWGLINRDLDRARGQARRYHAWMIDANVLDTDHAFAIRGGRPRRQAMGHGRGYSVEF